MHSMLSLYIFIHTYLYIHIIGTPPFCCRGGDEPPTKFSKKGGLDRTSIFRGRLLAKRG